MLITYSQPRKKPRDYKNREAVDNFDNAHNILWVIFLVK